MLMSFLSTFTDSEPVFHVQKIIYGHRERTSQGKFEEKRTPEENQQVGQ